MCTINNLARREYQSYLDKKNKASEDIKKCQTSYDRAKATGK